MFYKHNVISDDSVRNEVNARVHCLANIRPPVVPTRPGTHLQRNELIIYVSSFDLDLMFIKKFLKMAIIISQSVRVGESTQIADIEYGRIAKICDS